MIFYGMNLMYMGIDNVVCVLNLQVSDLKFNKLRPALIFNFIET